MPKGYAKVVERLRKHQMVKAMKQKEIDLQVSGQRYNQQKLQKMKPPSFLIRDAENK